jgi:hypothetical protein
MVVKHVPQPFQDRALGTLLWDGDEGGWVPDRPGDGKIYFRGPDPHRVWRCDYIAGVARDLGFDD